MNFSPCSVEKGVVFSLVFIKVIVGCVKIVYTSPALIEYYPCTIVKVYAGGWVHLCVDDDPELGRHCVKGEYIRTLGGILPFSLTLPNISGVSNGKSSTNITPEITLDICLLRAPRLMTVTLNFSEG